jgi:hypothetical protein
MRIRGITLSAIGAGKNCYLINLQRPRKANLYKDMYVIEKAGSVVV